MKSFLDPDSHLRTSVMQLRIALDKQDYETAVEKSDEAVATLQNLITKGKSHPSVWQSMLFEWSRIDGLQLEAYVKAKRSAEECLSIAEAAKGRVFRLYRMISTLGIDELSDQEEMKNLISSTSQQQLIKNAQHWVKAEKQNYIISFFCCSSGIAVISLSSSGADYHWFDGPIYDHFRDGIYNHWEQLSDWALDSRLQSAALKVGAPPDLVLNSAQAVSELLLDWLGNMLVSTLPEISEGGNELVIIPHRCFRSLPLAHSRLFSGKYLSELFQRVTIAPTLGLFAAMMPDEAQAINQLDMFLDPEQDLPLARLEANLGCARETHIGVSATQNKFWDALAQPGGLLLSAHSNFDPLAPFDSWLALSDGTITLADLFKNKTIKRQLIVLSSCESGLSQRSNSDEPFGFPALLQFAGVNRIIAPSWRVDDLATLLLMSEFHRLIAEGQAPEQAIYRACHWLRKVRADQALETIESIEGLIPQEQQSLFADTLLDLRQQKNWLHKIRFDIQYPFQSPIFWAGFQTYG